MDDKAFVTLLASELNGELNVPFFDEVQEQAVLEKVLTAILPVIPPYVRQPMLDAADGLTDEEIDFWVGVLTTWVVSKDLTPLPEFIEDPMFQTAIPAVADAVLTFARKGFSLDLAP